MSQIYFANHFHITKSFCKSFSCYKIIFMSQNHFVKWFNQMIFQFTKLLYKCFYVKSFLTFFKLYTGCKIQYINEIIVKLLQRNQILIYYNFGKVIEIIFEIFFQYLGQEYSNIMVSDDSGYLYCLIYPQGM